MTSLSSKFTMQAKPPLASILTMILIQLVFYSIPAIIIYWSVTLNWKMIMICLAISLAQAFLIKGRSQAYVQLLSKWTRVGEFAKFERIYDGGQRQRLDTNQRTLFCYHPHSVFGYGIILNTNHPKFHNQLLSKAVIIGSNFALNVPILGMHLKLWGITGADQKNFKNLLMQGKTVSLLPGGYEQATLTTPKEVRVFIKKRKGFIKYALKYNYTIKQVLVMNQHKAFWTFDKFLDLRLLLNLLKIPGVIFWGPWGPFFPPEIQMTTVIGKGLKGRSYKQEEEPTNEQIDEMHQRYMQQLMSLYQRHKEFNNNCELKFY